MSLVVLDPDADLPPYEQVRSQIAEAIAAGTLRSETRLPTVRKLAGDLGLAVNTVARAYRELEMAGLIETRGRNGTFVAGRVTPARKSAASAARTFVRRMEELGFGQAESLAIVRREIESSDLNGMAAP